MNSRLSILITGGAGFIGRRLTHYLLKRGVRVTALDVNLDKRRVELAAFADTVEYVDGDVKDERCLFSLVKGKDCVIHLAAGASFLMYEERPVYETVNVVHGFLNVLEAVKYHKVNKLVYASTSAVYEGNTTPYHEAMDLHPPDHKALAKKTCEEYAQLYRSRYGVSSVGVRPFSVYGESEIEKGCLANVISLFSWTMIAGNLPLVWGDGNQTRDFIYVDDAAEAFGKCALEDVTAAVINAGTGIKTSFNEVLMTINHYLGTKIAPVYEPVPISVYATNLQADTARQRKFGLIPKVGVKEGIGKVIASAKRLEPQRLAELAGAQRGYTSILARLRAVNQKQSYYPGK